jgi:hypothetical protein
MSLINLRGLAKPGDIAIFVFYRCNQQAAAYISGFLLYLRTRLYQ